jgi:hypothetical protein
LQRKVGDVPRESPTDKMKSMATASVKVIEEVSTDWHEDGWRLCFQWCEYRYSENTKHDRSEMGYRFIWRRPDGKLQPARGQARLPSISEAEKLMAKAKSAGWGHLTDGAEATRSAR